MEIVTTLDHVTTDAYSMAFVAGTFVTAWLAWREATRAGFAPEVRAVLLAATLLAGLVGARLLPLYARLPHDGEKTVLGALLGGAMAVAAVAWWFRTGPRLFDTIIPAVPVGMAIGRVGCWLVGCCAGTPTSLPWGTAYAAGTPPFNALVERGMLPASAASTMPLHPVQLYEALADLLLVALVMRMPLRATAARPLAFGATYALVRAGLESLRAEHELNTGLSPLQWVLLVVAALLAVVCVVRERAARASHAHLCMPAAARCTAGPAPHRVDMMLGAVVTVAVIVLPWGAPTERALVQSGALLACGALVWRRFGRTATITGAGVGALLQVPVDTITPPTTDSIYPRSYLVAGGSGAVGMLTTHDKDCDGNDVTSQRHQFLGSAISAAWQRQYTPDVGLGLTASAGAGVIDSDAEVALSPSFAPSASPASRTNYRGGGLAINLDGRLLGVTLGVAAGRLPWIDEVTELTRVTPVAGLRIGRLSKGFAELQIGDPNVPDWMAAPPRLGGAYVFDDRGSLLRAGVSRGPYVAARLVTRQAWEIEPWVQVEHEGISGRIGIRRRIGISRKAR